MNARLGIGAVVRRTFSIYAEHALVLIVAAVSVGVLNVLSDGHTGVAHSLAVGNLVAFVLFTGFVVLLTADVCEGRAVRTVGELLRASASAFFPILLVGSVAVLAISLLFSIAPLLILAFLVGAAFAIPTHFSNAYVVGLFAGALVSMFLLIAPGVLLMIRWSVALPVVVLERPGRLRALRMSRRLVRGNGRRVLALIVLLGLPLTLVSRGVDAAAATAGNGPSIAVRIVVATLILPIPVLAAVALYFELHRGSATSVHQTDGVGPPTIGPPTTVQGACHPA